MNDRPQDPVDVGHLLEYTTYFTEQENLTVLQLVGVKVKWRGML